MPRRVTDHNRWRPRAPQVCVGQARNPWRLNGTGGQRPCPKASKRVRARRGYSATLEPFRSSGGPVAWLCSTVENNARELAAPPVAAKFAPVPFTGDLRLLDDITQSCCESILEYPPQRQVRKKLELPARCSNGRRGGSRLRFEWIADGCAAVSFWTALRRWIVALEGCPRFEGFQAKTSAVPTESQ